MKENVLEINVENIYPMMTFPRGCYDTASYDMELHSGCSKNGRDRNTFIKF